jgi:hypothetical protein
MLGELQSLAGALIKSEKRIEKLKVEHKGKDKKLKSVIGEQEECIQLLEKKAAKLEIKLLKSHKGSEHLQTQVSQEKNLGEQQIRAMQDKLDSVRQQMIQSREAHEGEKKDIIINMEREIQT